MAREDKEQLCALWWEAVRDKKAELTVVICVRVSV